MYKSSEFKEKLSLNIISSLYVSETEKYFATFSSGGSLDILVDFDSKGYNLAKTVKLNKKLQEAISLSILNEDFLLLLTGGYDSVINIYSLLRSSSKLKDVELVSYKFALKGHINSIKDISVISSYNYKDIKKDMMMVATCSQDCYIRLWSIVEIKLDDIVKEDKERQEIFEQYKTKTSYVLKVDNGKFYNIILDSVLLGHDESVSSIKWAVEKRKNSENLVLLSSSFDFTIGLWRYSDQMVKILF